MISATLKIVDVGAVVLLPQIPDGALCILVDVVGHSPVREKRLILLRANCGVRLDA